MKKTRTRSDIHQSLVVNAILLPLVRFHNVISPATPENLPDPRFFAVQPDGTAVIFDHAGAIACNGYGGCVLTGAGSKIPRDVKIASDLDIYPMLFGPQAGQWQQPWRFAVEITIPLPHDAGDAYLALGRFDDYFTAEKEFERACDALPMYHIALAYHEGYDILWRKP